MQARALRLRCLSFVAITALACSACASGNSPHSGAAPGSLIITPADVELVIVNGAPAAQDYRVQLVGPDGRRSDVTDAVALRLEKSQIGSFSSATLNARGDAVGESLLWARLGDSEGEASVTVRLKTITVDASAPSDAPDLFDGATEDPTIAPTIVYPESGTLFPPNLGTFDVHWTSLGVQDVFELRARTEFADITIYTGGTLEGAGRWQEFSAAVWNALGDDARGKSVDLTLRGLTISNPTSVGTATLAAEVSAEPIKGGIYYWAAGQGGPTDGIYRYDMGAASNEPEPYYTGDQSHEGRCVGCHAISRNGERMALTMDGPEGPGAILDVGTRRPLAALNTMYWNFAAFNPSGGLLLTVAAGVLTMRDSETGAELSQTAGAGTPTHPDFAPSGLQVVYTSAPELGTDWTFTDGSLVTRSFDPSTNQFGAEVILRSEAGANLYYPSFSPDGKWIVYSRSTGDSYDAPSAEIFVIRADGSAAPIKLEIANIGSGLTNSWVRWAPFEFVVDPTAELAEPLFWFTFSSKRAFGVRLDQGTPQLWMAPFYPDRMSSTAKSAPAFRMPFQQINTGNHIAQWTQRVVSID